MVVAAFGREDGGVSKSIANIIECVTFLSAEHPLDDGWRECESSRRDCLPFTTETLLDA